MADIITNTLQIGSNNLILRDADAQEQLVTVKDGLNVTVGNLDNATGVYRAEWEKGGLRAADGVEYDGANLRTKYIDVMPSTPIIINNDSGVKVVLYEFTGAKVLAKRTSYSQTINSVSLGSTTEYIRFQLESGSNQDVFLAQSVYVSSGKKNLSLDLNNVIKLTNGTDFNTLPSGNYYVSTASSASSMVNCPSQFGGRLIVIDLYMSSDNRLQIYNDSTGGAFYRIGNTSGFQSWKKVITNVEVMNYVFATSFTYGTELKAEDDLNAFRTTGNYYVSSRSVAEQILNIPEISGGKLVVMTLASIASVHQLYISSSNNWYIRQLISGTFTEWKKFDFTSNVISEIKTEAIATKSDNQTIADNTNIDSIITAGNYNVGSAAHAQTMTNLPSKLGGRLVVLHLYRTDSVCQLYMDSNSDWYKRQLISGTFTNWEKLTTQSDVDDSIRNSIVSKSAYNVIRAIIDNTDYNLAFANAFAPIGLKGYTGNNQNVHPKVLYFSSGFGGHKYWMAYTPYPYSIDGYENPCIAYSDDGYTFRNIAGNPLDDPNGNGYNSDTHLVYRSDTNTLECWYRYVGATTQTPREETIYRQTTTDGVTWTAKELVYSNTSGDYANFLSPSIIVENNKYCMWVVRNSNGIDYWEAPLSDVTSWTKIRTFNVTTTDKGITVKPWHIDVIKDGTKYVILMMCRNGTSVTNNACSLFVITSTDNITYTSPIKVVEGQDGWDKFMYRSSIVKVGDTYRIYYSAGTGGTTSIYSNSTWGIGITESNTLTGGYIGRYF